MKKLFLLGLILITTNPVMAVKYTIEEADQELAGFYRQQIEYQKWKDSELQVSESDKASAEAYEQGVRAYEEMMRKRAAQAAFYGALSNSLQAGVNQMQQQQAINQQKANQLNAQMAQQQAAMKSYLNDVKARNYSSVNYYNSAPKSNNGYPIIDPYAAKY